MERNFLPSKFDKYLVHQMMEQPILNLQILIFFSTKIGFVLCIFKQLKIVFLHESQQLFHYFFVYFYPRIIHITKKKKCEKKSEFVDSELGVASDESDNNGA